jgi:hypothetical protein
MRAQSTEELVVGSTLRSVKQLGPPRPTFGDSGGFGPLPMMKEEIPMACEDKIYYCNCSFSSTEYESLEDHIVSHAKNGNGSNHYYFGYCCGCGCTLL